MNINNKFLGLFAILIFAISILSSCNKKDIDETISSDTETIITDCSDLDLNIGDDCVVDSLLVDGTVTDDCECKQCPTLNANTGDDCTTAAGEDGFVNSDCECEGLAPVIDCASLNLNIGDNCIVDSLLVDGTVTDDCECKQCPTLNANTGDDCTTAAGEDGFVNSDCECQSLSPSYDCPSLFLNIGDICYNAQGDLGTVDSNCDCDVSSSEYCPSWGLNVGDECSYWDIDPISNDTIQVQGILDINCQCF